MGERPAGRNHRIDFGDHHGAWLAFLGSVDQDRQICLRKVVCKLRNQLVALDKLNIPGDYRLKFPQRSWSESVVPPQWIAKTDDKNS